MIKLLIGGSPCTYWSIAQKNGRETEASGMGWELFKNYLIAKEKFKPDFFLYENNKSAAQAIKDQISEELGVELMYINSALVSAQNRQRFYAFNWNVEQPEDRGIVLRDILESGVVDREKSYPLLVSHQGNARDYFKKQYAQIVCEPVPVNITNDGKAQCIRATCYKDGIRNLVGNEVDRRTCVAEPIRIGDIGSTAQAHRAYSCDGKSVTLSANGGGQGGKTGLYATPIKVGEIGKGGQGNRIYSVDGKSVAQTANSGGLGSNTGLYAEPVENVGECETIQKAIPKLVDKFGYVPEQFNAYNLAEISDKSPTLSTGSMVTSSCATTIFEKSNKPVYEVKNGLITIKDKQYPIKLADGYYIIRKLTPVECERLQTLPDGYTRGVSNTQRYKALGNGWTAEVIIHILNGALKDVPKDEEIVVLSMYDGIGTGRYCLDKMGFTNVKYFAYEIDKYPKQIAMNNYPDIIQLGDAFDLRHPDWTIGY